MSNEMVSMWVSVKQPDFSNPTNLFKIPCFIKMYYGLQNNVLGGWIMGLSRPREGKHMATKYYMEYDSNE